MRQSVREYLTDCLFFGEIHLNILSLDIGTSSLKAALISQEGKILSFVRKSVQAKEDSFCGLQWYSLLVQSVKEILLQNLQINAIAVSGNGPTLVTPSGRTLLWNDPLSNNIPQRELVAAKNSKSIFIPQLLNFKYTWPLDFKDSSLILSGPEYIVFRLTGEAITVLPEERFLTAYWNDEKLLEAGFSKEEINKLPPFKPLGFTPVNLTTQARNELGLSETIPVIATGPDFVAALIGTNTLKTGRLCDRAGSSEGINLCTHKPVFSPEVRTLPSVIPGLWNVSIIIEKSGSLINHFKHELNDLQNSSNSFEQTFDYSFSDKNSEGWRILLELENKVAKGVKTLLSLAEENSIPVENIMTVTGGQAKNHKWLEEKAQTCKIDLAINECVDSELMGNAVVAFTTLGVFDSLQSGADQIVHQEEIFRCNPEETTRMKIYRIPEKLETIIFDIDSTLYTCEAYAFEQVDVQIRAWAEKNNMSHSQARNKISQFRKEWSREHDGKKISLGNTLTYFGVSIQESIEMRRNLVLPEKFLTKDEKLIEVLSALKEKYKLICVTNNPVLPAKKTLIALGVDHLISEIIGLDTCGKSKPAREPFELALEKTQTQAQNALSVGDRYDLDLALPLEMGMGAVLVTGVKDVYKLKDILL